MTRVTLLLLVLLVGCSSPHPPPDEGESKRAQLVQDAGSGSSPVSLDADTLDAPAPDSALIDAGPPDSANNGIPTDVQDMLTRLISLSVAASVTTVSSIQSVETDAPPFMSSDVFFRNEQVLWGTPPADAFVFGGANANVTVVMAHNPTFSTSYAQLVLFGSQRSAIASFPMLDAGTVSVRDVPVPVSYISTGFQHL